MHLPTDADTCPNRQPSEFRLRALRAPLLLNSKFFETSLSAFFPRSLSARYTVGGLCLYTIYTRPRAKSCRPAARFVRGRDRAAAFYLPFPTPGLLLRAGTINNGHGGTARPARWAQKEAGRRSRSPLPARLPRSLVHAAAIVAVPRARWANMPASVDHATRMGASMLEFLVAAGAQSLYDVAPVNSRGRACGCISIFVGVRRSEPKGNYRRK